LGQTLLFLELGGLRVIGRVFVPLRPILLLVVLVESRGCLYPLFAEAVGYLFPIVVLVERACVDVVDMIEVHDHPPVFHVVKFDFVSVFGLQLVWIEVFVSARVRNYGDFSFAGFVFRHFQKRMRLLVLAGTDHIVLGYELTLFLLLDCGGLGGVADVGVTPSLAVQQGFTRDIFQSGLVEVEDEVSLFFVVKVKSEI